MHGIDAIVVEDLEFLKNKYVSAIIDRGYSAVGTQTYYKAIRLLDHCHPKVLLLDYDLDFRLSTLLALSKGWLYNKFNKQENANRKRGRPNGYLLALEARRRFGSDVYIHLHSNRIDLGIKPNLRDAEEWEELKEKGIVDGVSGKLGNQGVKLAIENLVRWGSLNGYESN